MAQRLGRERDQIVLADVQAPVDQGARLRAEKQCLSAARARAVAHVAFHALARSRIARVRAHHHARGERDGARARGHLAYERAQAQEPFAI